MFGRHGQSCTLSYIKGRSNTSRIENSKLYAYFMGKNFFVSRKKLWIAKGLGFKVCWCHPRMLCQCLPMFQFGTWDGSIMEKCEVCLWWKTHQKSMIVCKKGNLEWTHSIGYILNFEDFVFLNGHILTRDCNMLPKYRTI